MDFVEIGLEGGNVKTDSRAQLVYVLTVSVTWLVVMLAAGLMISGGTLSLTDAMLLVFLLSPFIVGLIIAEILVFSMKCRSLLSVPGWKRVLRIYLTYIVTPGLCGYLFGTATAALFDRRREYFSWADIVLTHAALLAFPAAAFCAIGLILLPLGARQRS